MLLIPLVGACRGWTPVATDQIGSEEAVRVRTLAGEEVRLTDPRVVGDSVVTGWAVEPAPGERSIPLRSIEVVESYGTDTAGTVQLVLISATGVGIWLAVRILSDEGGVS